MIDYATQDAPVDAQIWSYIADSVCPQDFRDYLQHAPEGAAYLNEAVDRLIGFDDADAGDELIERRYPAVAAAIEALATAGSAVAQFHIAKLFDRGIGIEADSMRAEGWYRAAILQGELRSHVNLALRVTGRDAPERIAEARHLLDVASAAGEGAATFQIAQLNREARGEVPRGYCSAEDFALFHRAWEQGYAVAGHWIGHMLLRGDGVRQDEALGREWIVRAAQAGCIGAILQLGGKAEQEEDIATAVTWFRRGAGQGDMECQHRLAHLLLRGEGIAKDGAQAVDWLKRAAVRGHADAQRILGLTYLWGVDVIRNARFGRKWLTRAAQQGDAYAAWHLGKLLQASEPPEAEAAFHWFEQAALAGQSEAQGVLGLCYWKGQGVTADLHAAFKWIRLCSLQGDPWGCYLLGRLYYSGVDVPVDYVRAAYNFRLSAYSVEKPLDMS